MKNVDRKSLGALLRDARKGVGLSQRELAEVLKVSDKAVSAYEVNRAKPSFETLKKIGKLTKKPISYFEMGDDDVEGAVRSKLETVEQELREIKELLKKRK